MNCGIFIPYNEIGHHIKYNNINILICEYLIKFKDKHNNLKNMNPDSDVIISDPYYKLKVLSNLIVQYT